MKPSHSHTEQDNRSSKASRWRNRLAYLLVLLLVGGLYLSGALDFAERRFDDIKFGMLERPATGDVVLVEIDAQSLSAIGVWPWPRGLHATLIERLQDAGAARIALDIDFSSYSTSDADAAFREALTAAERRVILPAFRQRKSVGASGREVIDTVPADLFAPYVDIAFLNVFPSSDGYVRSLSVDGDIGGKITPSLAATLAGGAFEAGTTFLIDFGIDPATVPRLSYADVLSGNFDPARVAGKQVVVGSTAAELGDYFAVPHRVVMPGPLVHILGYESIAQNRMLQRLAPIPTLFLSALIIVVLALVAGPLRIRYAFLVALVAFGAVFGAAVLVQQSAPVKVDVFPLLLAVVLTFVATMANRLDQQALRLLFQGSDIRRKNAMMRNLVDKSIVGVVICASDGRIISANGAAAAIFGHAEATLPGEPIGRLLPDLSVKEEHRRGALKRWSMEGQRETWGRREDGSRFPAEVMMSEVDSEGDIVFTAFVNDITLRHRHEAELQYRADHDELTGLSNRTMFSRLLDVALSDAAGRETGVGVFLLDLDRFKNVNDTLGHAVGDRLLQDVARRLSTQMPEGALLARFGGDEFAVFLPGVSEDAQYERLAADIVEALRKPFAVDHLSLEVGGSIGCALSPDDGVTAELLLQRADIAMYSAKRLQGGFAKYWADDDAHSVRNLTMTGDLRAAIENDELELAFQPKVDIATGRTMGAEVLCRWDRPGHGMVSPDEFIDHAEQSGLIFPLTKWVLGKAVETGAIWRELGWDLNIAVNLSARLLHHEQILALVTETLERRQYPAESLTLEITENALMVNPGHAMIVISEFSALGIKVSIDDFGTGYSSLSYLTTLAASELKIDKSFVLGMEREASYKTIVKSVVMMAHELDLRVVAEGIETEDVVSLLQGLDCDFGQGYLFGKPMSSSTFEGWLRSGDWPAARLSHEIEAQRA